MCPTIGRHVFSVTGTWQNLSIKNPVRHVVDVILSIGSSFFALLLTNFSKTEWMQQNVLQLSCSVFFGFHQCFIIFGGFVTQ